MTGLLLPENTYFCEGNNNPKDKSAIAGIKVGEIVGHIPYNMSNSDKKVWRETSIKLLQK